MPPKLTTSQRYAAAIVRLEREQGERQQEFLRVRRDHIQARAQLLLLHALTAASDALQHVLVTADAPASPQRAEAAADAGRALEECEEMLAVLRQQLWRRRNVFAVRPGTGGQPGAAGGAIAPIAAVGGESAQAPARSVVKLEIFAGQPPGGDSSNSGDTMPERTACGLMQRTQQQQQQQLAWDGRQGTVSVVAFFEHVRQARSTQVDPQSFVRWWQERATRLGALLHQRARSTAAAASSVPAATQTAVKVSREINDLWLALGAAPFGLMLSGRPWVARLFGRDLDGASEHETDSDLWDWILAVIAPTPEQGLLLALLHGWWQRRNELQKERLTELLASAQEAPSSYEAQTSLISGLERAQNAYVRNSTAATAVLLTALLAPEQCAELFAQAWPTMPCMTALLDRWHSRCMATADTQQQTHQRLAGTARTTVANGTLTPAAGPGGGSAIKQK